MTSMSRVIERDATSWCTPRTGRCPLRNVWRRSGNALPFAVRFSLVWIEGGAVREADALLVHARRKLQLRARSLLGRLQGAADNEGLASVSDCSSGTLAKNRRRLQEIDILSTTKEDRRRLAVRFDGREEKGMHRCRPAYGVVGRAAIEPTTNGSSEASGQQVVFQIKLLQHTPRFKSGRGES